LPPRKDVGTTVSYHGALAAEETDQRLAPPGIAFTSDHRFTRLLPTTSTSSPSATFLLSRAVTSSKAISSAAFKTRMCGGGASRFRTSSRNPTIGDLEDAAHRGEDVLAAGRAGVACRRRERGRVRQRSTCREPAREEGRRLISFTHFLIRPLSTGSAGLETTVSDERGAPAHGFGRAAPLAAGPSYARRRTLHPLRSHWRIRRSH